MTEKNERTEFIENDGAQMTPATPEQVAVTVRAEIDTQVATARHYGRSITEFRNRLKEMATLTAKIAESCMYEFPRGKGTERKWIRGPSIVFAKLVAAAWEHLRVAGRDLPLGPNETMVSAEGMCWDLCTNNSWRTIAKRKITYGKDSKFAGQRFGEDMVYVTTMAAISIAQRNAVLKVVPQPLYDDIFDEVVTAAKGGTEGLHQRRASLLAWYDTRGVTVDALLAIIGVKGLDDVGIDELYRMRAMATSIKEGEIMVEDLLEDISEAPEPKGLTSLKEAKRKKEEAAKKAADKAVGNQSPPTGETKPDEGGAV